MIRDTLGHIFVSVLNFVTEHKIISVSVDHIASLLHSERFLQSWT